MIICNYF